jgi:undecaprenyl-phosphate 4-deoxy-4-formamido-L-arabinose transferase
LQLARVIGAPSAAGVATLAYVLGVYFVHGRDVPGFAFLASVVAIFSGAQLFALGIIGEYLARMHFRSMDRPPYVVLGQSRQAAVTEASRLSPCDTGAAPLPRAEPSGGGKT